MSTKLAVIACAIALGAISSTFYQWSRAQRAEAQSAGLALDCDRLRSQLGSEQQIAAQSAREIAELRRQIERSRSRLGADQRSETHPAQDVAGSQSGTEMQQAGQPKGPATDAGSPKPAAESRAAAPLDADELRLASLRPTSKAAIDAYHAAHGGQEPPNPEALLPYFATPQQGADFFEFLGTLKHAGEKQGSQSR